MKSISTALGASPKMLATPTGSRPPTTGSAALPSTASRDLLASEPAQTDRRLEASLAQSVKSWLFWRNEKAKLATGGEAPTHDRMIAQYRQATRPEWLEGALKSYRLAMLPAPDDVVAKELGSMCALTVRRERSDDTAVYILAMVDRLRKWPGDVVIDVLRSQPDHGKWRPAWEEILLRLESAAKRRKSTLALLEDMAA